MKKILFFIFLICTAITCNKKNNGGETNPNPATTVQFAKGADISWLTEMEAAGRKFYNSAGAEQECVLLLKNLGMNTIRLRVWVNPASGWNNRADVVNKALRAKNLGIRIMIDFHYSDTWADPGHQTKPASWAGQEMTTLKTSLYNHTTDVLNDLKIIASPRSGYR